MEAHAEELAQLETLDNGKPINFARGDVFASIDAIRYYAGWADKIHGSTHNVNMPGEYHVYTLLKPAEDTSLSALRLGELMQEAGLPDGVVNVLTGYGRTVGAALASHPGIDKNAFTGSTVTGKTIAHAAADGLKKVSLELGGKSPNIIMRDADLAKAIPASAMGIFKTVVRPAPRHHGSMSIKTFALRSSPGFRRWVER